jgi:hypothetical protein
MKSNSICFLSCKYSNLKSINLEKKKQLVQWLRDEELSTYLDKLDTSDLEIYKRLKSFLLYVFVEKNNSINHFMNEYICKSKLFDAKAAGLFVFLRDLAQYVTGVLVIAHSVPPDSFSRFTFNDGEVKVELGEISYAQTTSIEEQLGISHLPEIERAMRRL